MNGSSLLCDIIYVDSDLVKSSTNKTDHHEVLIDWLGYINE